MVTIHISHEELKSWKYKNKIKRDYLENNKLEATRDLLEGLVKTCKSELFWYPSRSIIDSLTLKFVRMEESGDYVYLDETDLCKILTPFINQNLVSRYRKTYRLTSNWDDNLDDLFSTQSSIDLYHVTKENKETLKKFSKVLEELIKVNKNSLLNLSA